MYCNANQSPCLGGLRSPMLEHELNLTHSLFQVQVPKGRASKACTRSEKDDAGDVTIESTFPKDDVHSLLLNSRQVLQAEMTVSKWVSDACWVNGEVVCPSFFVFKCTSRGPLGHSRNSGSILFHFCRTTPPTASERVNTFSIII
jgi:hypothetical protein